MLTSASTNTVEHLMNQHFSLQPAEEGLGIPLAVEPLERGSPLQHRTLPATAWVAAVLIIVLNVKLLFGQVADWLK